MKKSTSPKSNSVEITSAAGASNSNGRDPVEACIQSKLNDATHSSERFRKAAQAVSQWAGSPMAFAAAFAVVGIWAVLGPVFHYSDTWQLVINTGTTIVTFLMVFLIQNSQNRDSKVMQLKVDELIRATKSARNQLVDLEDLTDSELDKLHAEFRAIHDQTSRHLQTIEARSKLKSPQT